MHLTPQHSWPARLQPTSLKGVDSAQVTKLSRILQSPRLPSKYQPHTRGKDTDLAVMLRDREEEEGEVKVLETAKTITT